MTTSLPAALIIYLATRPALPQFYCLKIDWSPKFLAVCKPRSEDLGALRLWKGWLHTYDNSYGGFLISYCSSGIWNKDPASLSDLRQFKMAILCQGSYFHFFFLVYACKLLSYKAGKIFTVIRVPDSLSNISLIRLKYFLLGGASVYHIHDTHLFFAPNTFLENIV